MYEHEQHNVEVKIGNKSPQAVVITTVENIHRHPRGAIHGEIELDGYVLKVGYMFGGWKVLGGEPIPERFR